MISSYKKRLKRLIEQSSTPKFSSKDLFVVEFPKSGITWLSFLLANVELQLIGEKQKVTFFNINALIPEAENLKYAALDRKFKNNFIKSHAAYTPAYPWVLYLVRNPLDVMVSYYNYRLDHEYKQDFNAFLDHPEYGIEAWCYHLNSWFKRSRNRANYLLLKYEDLRSDTMASIKSIYRQLGYDLSDEILTKAVSGSSLDYMKTQEEEYKKLNPGYVINFVGKSGKKFSKEDMTEAQEAKISQTVNAQLPQELKGIYKL